MLFDEHEPLSMTEYLGCLSAFVGQFDQALYTMSHFAVAMEGQSRAHTFGWAASLDQARYNASLIVDRWGFFNETADQRLGVSPEEAALYESLPSVAQALERRRELEDLTARVNKFIDEIETFTPDEVRLIREMAVAVGQEIDSERTFILAVTARFEASDHTGPELTEPDSGLLMIGKLEDTPNFSEIFATTREQFSLYLREG